jgi:hypothetical protein
LEVTSFFFLKIFAFSSFCGLGGFLAVVASCSFIGDKKGSLGRSLGTLLLCWLFEVVFGLYKELLWVCF